MKLIWNERDITAGDTVWIKSGLPTAWPYVKLTIVRSEGSKKRDGTRSPDKWLLFNQGNNWATQMFGSKRAMAMPRPLPARQSSKAGRWPYMAARLPSRPARPGDRVIIVPRFGETGEVVTFRDGKYGVKVRAFLVPLWYQASELKLVSP